MNTKDYQKKYKKSYLKTNKIITFPLYIDVYKDLNKRASYFNLSSNSFAKEIVSAFLQNTSLHTLSTEQRESISEYMRISRWIANNINQIAHRVNIEGQIDIAILVNTLKHYEAEFKKFLTKF